MKSSEHEGPLHGFAFQMILALNMFLYIVLGSWIEKSGGCGFGHETGAVILTGTIVSGIFYATDLTPEEFAFSPKFLFEIGLPLILFSAGYNMRRRRFFENFSNITIFGVLSTLTTFIVLALLTWLMFKQGAVTKYTYDETTSEW